jgi:hypothetical protein
MARHITRPVRLRSALDQLLTTQGWRRGVDSITTLNQLWGQVAGEGWRQCSWVHRWQDGVLEIGVTNPGAATRLRFESAALCSRLQQAGLEGLQTIVARVQPQPASEREPRHRRYSATAAQRVAEEASEVADPDLRAALNRLAGHLHRPPENQD